MASSGNVMVGLGAARVSAPLAEIKSSVGEEVKSSVMGVEYAEVAWRYQTHAVDMLGMGSIPVVRNVAEFTAFAFLDTLLAGAETDEERIIITAAAWGALVGAKGKYLMAMPSGTPITQVAKEGVNTDLATNVGLFYADLKAFDAKEGGALLLSVVSSEDRTSCERASKFQTEQLAWFRRLDPEKIDQKTKERYEIAAFRSRVKSKGIYVFTFEDKDELVATITLNLHRADGVTTPSDHRVGYVSDLFVREGWHDKPDFMKQFMKGFFAKIKESFPEIEFLWGMAATSNETIPIAYCFNAAKKAGLLRPMTDEVQQRLGGCVRLDGGKATQDKHTGRSIAVSRKSLFQAAIVTRESAPAVTFGM